MAATRKRWSNSTWRVWTVAGLIGLGTVVVIVRLAQLQIIDHQEYADEARLMHINQIAISDRRGALLDRNGYPLAASEDAYNVMVERDDWADSAEAADSAAQIS